MTFLGGEGGGLQGNLQRWAGSVGLNDIPETTPITVGGHDGQLFDGVGPHTLQDGNRLEEARMMAVYSRLGPGTITIKIVGPKAEVDAREADFLRFVASIRPKPQETGRQLMQRMLKDFLDALGSLQLSILCLLLMMVLTSSVRCTRWTTVCTKLSTNSLQL